MECDGFDLGACFSHHTSDTARFQDFPTISEIIPRMDPWDVEYVSIGAERVHCYYTNDGTPLELGSYGAALW